jgi:two-component system sensor histidine kinase KdpD
LLSAVSHDLRTPLAAITGAATSLRDDTMLSTPTREELLESICEEAERMERLVGNLLEMTRLESGIALHREWVPLVEVVGSALTRLEDRLGDRHVSTSLEPDLPLVSIDPVLFEQIFVNLLENAVKYTPAGTPIEIDARRVEAGIEIEVADRGPGLPEGSEERVFEKFYRGAHVGVSGVGLGLAICLGIVQAHGGTMRALKREGGGVVFRVTLPSTGEPPTVLDAREVAG